MSGYYRTKELKEQKADFGFGMLCVLIGSVD